MQSHNLGVGLCRSQIVPLLQNIANEKLLFLRSGAGSKNNIPGTTSILQREAVVQALYYS